MGVVAALQHLPQLDRPRTQRVQRHQVGLRFGQPQVGRRHLRVGRQQRHVCRQKVSGLVFHLVEIALLRRLQRNRWREHTSQGR